ncbi:WD repeat and SOCS box-containing protein 2 isoform X1 [Alosa pseudoharengus]|uniref:WD repeat and SOCS box-containing protein 2 isoform X1 n=1 Tax=Alosa pseudoharengus TaxID=34774 RepID=UPI003F8A793E
MCDLFVPDCPIDNNTKGISDGLVEQLRPIHPQTVRGTAGCETWTVDFSPGGSLFAWSMGYGVVKVLAWPLPNEEGRDDDLDAQLTKKASERTLNCGQTVWGLAFGPRPRKRPGAISHITDGSPLTEDVKMLILATGLNNGIIKIWRISTGEALYDLKGHQSVVRELVFPPNGTLTLVSGSRDKTLRIWDLTSTGRTCHVLSGHRGWVLCCRVSPDSSMIASVCSSDNRVSLWSLRSYTFMKHLAFNKRSAISSCDFSPDGAVLAVGSYSSHNSAGWRVDLWDPYTAELLVMLEDCCSCEPFINSKTIKTLCFSPDGLYLALVVDHSRALRLWELGQKTFVMETDLTTFHNELCCTFHPQGGIIATGTRDGHAKFWKARPIVPSLTHLCRAALRFSVSTHQINALPIPHKLLEFLTYRDLPKTQETYCRAHCR